MIKNTTHLICNITCLLLLFFGTANAQTSPTFTSTGITSGTENVLYSYPITATDADNDVLAFTTPTLPAWLTLTQNQTFATDFGSAVTSPSGIAADDDGNVYVCNNSNLKIYKIQPDGTTTDWATRGVGNTYTMAVYNGDLYISYHANASKITKISLGNPSGGETTVITGLNSPAGITSRGGFLYVALYGAGKIIRFNPALAPLAYSTGLDYIASGVTTPFGIAFDSNGILYISQYLLNKVSKYNGTVLSDAVTSIINPSDIKIDNSDNLYVSFRGAGVSKYKADLSSSVKVYPSGNIYTMTSMPSGTLFISVWDGNKVVKLESGSLLTGTPSHTDVGVHPVSINVSDGVNTVNQSFNITVGDITPPTVTTYSPLNGATAVANASTLSLTFSETIKKGTGNIYVRNAADNSIVQQIDVTGSNVTISGSTLTINPNVILPDAVNLYITIDGTAFSDPSDNAYAGINNTTTWAFTSAVMNFAPVFTSASLVSGTENVPYNNTITATDANGDALTFTALLLPSWLNFNPATGVLSGTPVHANVGVNAVSINVSDGVNTVNQSFNITVGDITLPTVSTYGPLNGATDVPIASNLSLTFDENIQKGTGDIYIKNVSDNSIVQQIDVTGGNVTVTGSTLIIDPATDLPSSGNLYITVDATAILDESGNANAGINSATTWTFATVLKSLQAITFGNIAAVTYGDPDFNQTASSSNSAIPVTYTSSDISIATVSLGSVHIVKTGSVTITASQAGDANFIAAADVSQVLTIHQKALTVSADNKTKFKNAANPPLTIVYEGFANADNAGNLTMTPEAVTTATTTSAAGDYTISVSGGVSENYSFAYMSGMLSVKEIIPSSINFPQITLLENQPAGTLAGILSTLSSDVSAIYTYSLVSGNGSDNNNLFSVSGNQLLTAAPLDFEKQSVYTIRVRVTTQSNDILEIVLTIYLTNEDDTTIKPNNLLSPNGDGINDVWVVDNILNYPNNQVQIFDRAGRILFTKAAYVNTWDATVNGSPLAEGTYYYAINPGNGTATIKGFITVIRSK